ncbi:hypothetical protein EVAR_59341_1 [Eumeta japonica]|uniref:Uncharacterized protein n=1 Tax=Eumeta variegata TaxID=151549 RepID=A0A4C1Z7L4_EUMVA|nr:hypothetical protein EVAR_59341_1 [Eumeta japonica]
MGQELELGVTKPGMRSTTDIKIERGTRNRIYLDRDHIHDEKRDRHWSETDYLQERTLGVYRSSEFYLGWVDFRIIESRRPVRSWVIHDLSLVAGTGRRTYCCLVTGSLLVRDTTPVDSVVMAPFQESNSWNFPDSAGDPEAVSVDSPSSSSIVTTGSGNMMK